ncbi:PoNe immunity protein domain-containing protein, partial [Paracidovorax avenae]
MMAFAKALHFNAAEMKRLIDAIGHPGEDALIDEGARALGDAQRPIAETCKFPKVYDPLLEVWCCDPAERPAKLLAFSKVWKKKIKPIYWSDSLNGADGAYFGYWCFDVALAAIALN